MKGSRTLVRRLFSYGRIDKYYDVIVISLVEGKLVLWSYENCRTQILHNEISTRHFTVLTIGDINKIVRKK